MKSGSKGPVVAAKFCDLTSANIAAGMLEDNGITAFVVDTAASTVSFILGFTFSTAASTATFGSLTPSTWNASTALAIAAFFCSFEG